VWEELVGGLVGVALIIVWEAVSGASGEVGFLSWDFVRECFRTPRRVTVIILILLLDGAGVYLLWRRFPPQWAMACFFAGGLVFVAGMLLTWRSWSKEERRRLARVRRMAEREGEGRAS
jgi:MFS superfamily sulfate permease-like transporter